MPHILVVDDDAGTLELFQYILRDAGCDVTLAQTGHDGLRLAMEQAPDLVLADLEIRGESGLDLLRQIREASGAVPVVLMTGFASTQSAVEAGRLGVAAYVEKPLFADELLALVRTYAVPASPSNQRATGALKAIADRFHDTGLSVRGVARDLGVSTEHLCRAIKRATGRTFVDHLREARVRAACGLLEDTSLSMKEIADLAGFSTAGRFARDFKAMHGVSPSAYRGRCLRDGQVRATGA
jgi:two-component system response regulator YesN